MEKNVAKKLLQIQLSLKVEKGKQNNHSHYKYRSASDILENIKPLLKEYGCTLIISDSIVEHCGSAYIESNVTLVDVESMESVSVSGYAREAQSLAGMSPGQITGATSSYARKYALGALFAIDDTKDLDDIAAETPPYPAQAPSANIDSFINALRAVKSADEFKKVWASCPSLQKEDKVVTVAKQICETFKKK